MNESSAPTRPPLILVVSDEEWSARSLASILGAHGYAVVRASSARQALDAARSTLPSAFFIELQLPDMDGLDLCHRLKELGAASASTPIVLTATGVVSYAQRLEAAKCGAWELLTQPFDATLLLHRLETFLRARREVEQLHDASLIDAPTGLYNARGLTRRAREIGADAQRRRAPLACVAFTLEVDDPADQEVGIDAIAEVAHHVSDIVRRTARVSDAVGRLGQSEFAVVAPATEAEGAVRLAERLQRIFRDEPAIVQGRSYSVRLRAGYAAVADLADSAVDAVELLMRASTTLRYGRVRHSDATILAFQELPGTTLPS